MKPFALILFAFFLAARAEARLVLIYIDGNSGPYAETASAEEGILLDKATDPVLLEKPDADPCLLPPPAKILQPLASAPSPEARVLPKIKAKNISLLLPKLSLKKGETITLYSLSWERLLEVRGVSSVSFPSGATLPVWIEKEFPKAIQAMAEHGSTSGEAVRFMYADVGADGIQKSDWEKFGIVFPADSAADAAPFVTRQDFEFGPHLSELTVKPRTATRTHRVRFFTRPPWTGKPRCPAAKVYPALRKDLEAREASLLVALTGWSETYTLSRQGIRPPKKDLPPPPWQ